MTMPSQLQIAREALERVRKVMLSVDVYVRSKQQIKDPEGWSWWEAEQDAVETALAKIDAALAAEGSPIDMVLHCPACGLQHIDVATVEWDNPSHRSHQCQRLGCGHIWRPADVPTNGVQAVLTRGKADSAPSPPRPEGEEPEVVKRARAAMSYSYLTQTFQAEDVIAAFQAGLSARRGGEGQ